MYVVEWNVEKLRCDLEGRRTIRIPSVQPSVYNDIREPMKEMWGYTE